MLTYFPHLSQTLFTIHKDCQTVSNIIFICCQSFQSFLWLSNTLSNFPKFQKKNQLSQTFLYFTIHSVISPNFFPTPSNLLTLSKLIQVLLGLLKCFSKLPKIYPILQNFQKVKISTYFSLPFQNVMQCPAYHYV